MSCHDQGRLLLGGKVRLQGLVILSFDLVRVNKANAAPEVTHVLRALTTTLSVGDVEKLQARL